MKTVSLALRNLTRNKRRNAILAVAIAFGFFVVTAIDGLTTGMVGNLENQITQLVGGNVVVQGLEWLNSDTPGGKAKLVNIVRDRDYARKIVDELNINYDYYSCFTMSSGTVIFNGKKSAIQLYGRDFNEKSLRDSFQFTSGGVDAVMKNGLIISDKVAESLNLQVGDEIIYSTWTVYGQNTFADMTITGIIKSNSFMNSMQAYADIEDVNEIVEMPEGGYSMFSLYLRDKDQQTKAAMAIEARIRQDSEVNPEINVTSRLEAMKKYPTNVGKGIEKQVDPKKPENEWKGVKYAVETLYDEIPQIKTVLNIVHIITTVILIVILMIVMVGVSNTYRMVLYERIREIGTMRAIGAEKKFVKRLFYSEAVILTSISSLAGIILAFICMVIFNACNIVITNEIAKMILGGGLLHFSPTASIIITTIVIAIAGSVISNMYPVKSALRITPLKALSKE